MLRMDDVKRIRALIVDDEPLGREVIRELLSADHEIEIVGDCRNGAEAVRSVLESSPDLMFLDVQMPGIDGFGVLDAIPPERCPLVVFVTAYDQYAVRAFEVYALDYLLKPFDHERFEKALGRAKDQLRKQRDGELSERIASLVKDLKHPPKHLERLVIKNSGRVYFLKTDEIDWFEAEDNYVRLHVGKDSHLFRETLSSLETRLDPGRFLRIHRSTIVNIDRVKELQPWFHGEYRVVLVTGDELTLTRNYRHKLQELLGKSL